MNAVYHNKQYDIQINTYYIYNHILISGRGLICQSK